MESRELYCSYGAWYQNRIIRALIRLIPSIHEAKDPEGVHKMRVATRRLRAALPLFRSCMRKKDYKRWISEIKRVTTALGRARDLDVQIEFLTDFRDSMLENHDIPDFGTGINALITSLSEERSMIQPILDSAVERIVKKEVIQEIKSYLRRYSGLWSTCSANDAVREVIDKGSQFIFETVDILKKKSDAIYDPLDISGHHQMRIAAKKLRYTLEAFQVILPLQVKEIEKGVKKLQDLLGEVHDCDVWINDLPVFITDQVDQYWKEAGEWEKIKRDINYLIANRKEKRQELYTGARNLWSSFLCQQIDERLPNLIADMFNETSDACVRDLYQEKSTPVTVALISDIHANLKALNRVMADIKANRADFILNAGDAAGFGEDPESVIKILEKGNVIGVRGNSDDKILSVKEHSDNPVDTPDADVRGPYWTCRVLKKPQFQYLQSLPQLLILNAGMFTILLTHKIDKNNMQNYLASLPEKMGPVSRDIYKAPDIIVSGHTHIQKKLQIDSLTLINPGSVGNSKDGLAYYALLYLTDEGFTVEMKTVDYTDSV